MRSEYIYNIQGLVKHMFNNSISLCFLNFLLRRCDTQQRTLLILSSFNDVLLSSWVLYIVASEG